MNCVVTTLAPSFLIGSFILAGNKNTHKISDGLDIRPDRTLDLRVSCT